MDVRSFWEAVKIAGDWIIDGGDITVLKSALEYGTNGSLSTGGRGHRWEHVLSELCVERGMTVANVGSRRKKYDLMINDCLRVQCKFLGSGNTDIKPRGRDRNGIRRYHKDDFDILAIAKGSCDCRYFIPSSEIADSHGWLKTSFKPEFHEWREKWSVLEGKYERPKRLFSL
jgi:hypothetical protein